MDPQDQTPDSPQQNQFQSPSQTPPIQPSETDSPLNTSEQTSPFQQPSMNQPGISDDQSMQEQLMNNGFTDVESSTNQPTTASQFNPQGPELPNQFNQTPPSPHESMQPPPSQKPKGRKKVIAIVSVLLAFILLGGSLAFGALVAYGQIDLGNNKIERQIASIMFKLPFFTPTPEFLLVATSNAHEEVTSFAFDSSIAVEVEGLEQDATNPLNSLSIMSPENPFDFSSFEIATSGILDYTDEENPKTKMNINVENAFEMDFITVDEVFYFKVNQLPTFVRTLFTGYGFDVDPFLNSWISYPIEELDTEADAMIQARKDTEVDTSEYEKFIEVMRSDVLPKVEVSDGSEAVNNSYKLHVTLTDDELESISRKLSGDTGLESYLETTSESVVENFEVNVWIHKDDFLIRKIEVYAAVSEASSAVDPATTDVLGTTFGLTQAQDVTVRMAFTVNLSDYGSVAEVTAPESSESIEEFVERITGVYESSPSPSMFPNPTSQLANARDAQRKSTIIQLASSVELFRLDKGTLPSNTNFWIQELVSGAVLSSVPASVEYSNGESCTKSVVNSSWCYESNEDKSDYIVYSRLESNAECTNPTQTAWFTFSSVEGRGATVCQDPEPSVGPQTFTE